MKLPLKGDLKIISSPAKSCLLARDLLLELIYILDQLLARRLQRLDAGVGDFASATL